MMRSSLTLPIVLLAAACGGSGANAPSNAPPESRTLEAIESAPLSWQTPPTKGPADQAHHEAMPEDDGPAVIRTREPRGKVDKRGVR